MKSRKIAPECLLFIFPALYVFYCVICSNFQGHLWDVNCWRLWAIFDVENGFRNVYKSWTDYLPLYHYVLYFWGKLHGGNHDAIYHHLYQLRYFTLLCEFIAGFFLLKLTYERYKNIGKSIAWSMLYFANIFVLYNTIVWGQVDGILAGLAFVSFFFAYKKKITWSIVFFVLAMNMKVQAIIFLPPIGLILLPLIIERFSWKNLLQWITIPLALQLLIIAPFIVAGDLDKLWYVVASAVDRFPVISKNAFNIWDIFLDGDLGEMTDKTLFLGISYHHWGLLMFFVSSFFALFHLLKYNYQRIIKKIKVEFSLEKALLSCALIPLLFFFFNTQMHERYVHPAFIFLTMYTILSKRPLPLIILSITYFVNLETVLDSFKLFGYVSRAGCAVFYFITIILLFLELYDKKFIKIKNRKNESRPVSHYSDIQ